MQEHLKSSVCLWLIFPTNIAASLRQRIITMRHKESIERQRPLAPIFSVTYSTNQCIYLSHLSWI